MGLTLLPGACSKIFPQKSDARGAYPPCSWPSFDHHSTPSGIQLGFNLTDVTAQGKPTQKRSTISSAKYRPISCGCRLR
jgi:hypothetical protein